MNITPTAGIAAAWSAVKTSPTQQPAQLGSNRQAKAGQAAEEAAEPRKSPPAPEGQGTWVDVRA